MSDAQPMTMAEKILARASGRPAVRPGDYLWARADSVILCDLAWTLVGLPVTELGARIVEPDRVVVTFDHTVPAGDAGAAALHRNWREFCAAHGVTRLHDIGRQGISHVLSVHEGHSRPGTLQVSVDTHANTCGAVGCLAIAMGMDIVADLVVGENWYEVPESVRVRLDGELSPGVMMRDIAQHVMSAVETERGAGRVVELTGPVVERASVPALMTLCNWTRKIQAVAGVVAPSAATLAYVRNRADSPFDPVYSDPDARYATCKR